MSGRHATHAPVRRSRWPRRFFVLIVVLATVAGIGYFGQDYLPGSVRDSVSEIADRFLSDDTGCDGSVAVEITASPDIAPALTDIFESESAVDLQVDGTCIEPTITARASSDVAGSIGPQSTIDLWVPDSSLWLSRVTADQIEFSEPTSIATSPLVGVASQPVADAIGWPDTEFSWSGVLSRDGPPATMIDPKTTSTGFATLLAAGVALGVGTEEADPTTLVGAMTQLSQNITPTVADAFAAVEAAPEEAPLFTAIEQTVANHNQTSGNQVVALYPSEGTVVFDYPAIGVSRPDTPATVRSAVKEIITTVGTPEAVQIMYEWGFRAPDGTAGPSMGIGDGLDPAPVQALPALPTDVSRQLVSQWTALSLDMRMLAIFDVSGSMIEADGGEQTRAELVRDAATTALGLFPETSSVGVWVFSTLENEETGADWRELVPVGPLTEDVGGVTRLEALGAAAAEIPAIVEENAPSTTRGWTGLYDTINGAFNAMNSAYDPGKVNSIVLLTDGADEPPPGEESDISLDELLTKIQGHDPSRPIPIIAIGMGEEADMEALTQIAEASGGFAAQALDPADIEDVFIQAMIERQCRPMCG